MYNIIYIHLATPSVHTCNFSGLANWWEVKPWRKLHRFGCAALATLIALVIASPEYEKTIIYATI